MVLLNCCTTSNKGRLMMTPGFGRGKRLLRNQSTMKRPDTYAVSWVLAEEPEDCNTVGTFVASPLFELLPNHAAPLELRCKSTSIASSYRNYGRLGARSLHQAPCPWCHVESQRSLAATEHERGGYCLDDDITTPALRFTIPPSSIHRLLTTTAIQICPFDETVLQIFGHHFVGELNWSAFDI